MRSPGGRAAVVTAAAAAAAAGRGAWVVLPAVAPGGAGRWERANHRGVSLTLLEGPAWCLGALVGVLAAPGLGPRVRSAAVLAVAGAGAFGVLDDLTGTSADKGLRGHVRALATGRVTTGALKVAGIGVTGLVTAALLLPGRRPVVRRAVDVLVGGGVVAGSANLLNLLDLRAGRALKVVLLPVPAVAAGGVAASLVAAAAGASVAVLDEDLGERGMLGDGGANAAGALLGAALVAATAGAGRAGAAARGTALAALLALTLASERVSFTEVIDRTPMLRKLDSLGRR